MKRPKFNYSFGKRSRLSLGYLFLLLIPYLVTRTLDMDSKGWYVTVVSFVSIMAITAFYVQFPLGGRLKQIPLFANIDWNMGKHKRVGKWLGFIFLLHPVFILAPRFMVSYDDGITSVIETIKAPQMLTGVSAWVLMIVWILFSVFKETLAMRYETWRFTHLLGFLAIATLATLHVTSVGSHGQFRPQFNLVWWGIYLFSISIVLYNHLVKPVKIKKHKFTLRELSKISSSDWQLIVENSSTHEFNFKAGQFVWLNTSGSAGGVNEHPFSVASCESDLPYLSFIIRELGDYTSSLDSLKIGQKVFIDGPYGSMDLDDSQHSRGLTLIAGGAGIGPMLSLLRALAARNESRPIRLIYGNQRFDQMVLQDEIKALEKQMKNFALQLVCVEDVNRSDVHTGVIDKDCIASHIDPIQSNEWAVYMCGPNPMINAVKASLKKLRIPSHNVHYEQLAF